MCFASSFRTIFGECVSGEEGAQLHPGHALAHAVDDVVAGGQVAHAAIDTQLLHTALEALSFLRNRQVAS